MTDTETLIKRLSASAEPVKPAAHPLKQIVKWSAFSVLYIVALTLCLGFRDDLSLKMHSFLFMLEILTLLSLVTASAYSISLLSAPDMYQRQRFAWLPAGLLVGFLVVLMLEWFETVPTAAPIHNIECLLCIMACSVVPACLIFHHLRQQATTHPYMAGGVALLTAWSIGCLILRLSEPTDSVLHLVQWHYLPMLGFSIAGMLLGRLFLKW